MNTRAQHAYSQASDHSPTVEELITEHLDLVKRIVYQMPGEIRANAAHEDLVSAGTVGLVEAAHRFDEKQGVKFLTFAYRRIKGAVIDFLRKNDVLSKSARARLGRLNELRSRFRDKHGRSPSTAELSDLADLPEKTVLKFLGYGQWTAWALSKPGSKTIRATEPPWPPSYRPAPAHLSRNWPKKTVSNCLRPPSRNCPNDNSKSSSCTITKNSI
jgi:RNA polymerase sigma factor (sigma-70 family)